MLRKSSVYWLLLGSLAILLLLIRMKEGETEIVLILTGLGGIVFYLVAIIVAAKNKNLKKVSKEDCDEKDS